MTTLLHQPVAFLLRPSNRLRLAVGIVLLVTCLLAIYVLAIDLRRQIEVQSSAKLDNVQWTMSQVEVELVRLVLAAEEARRENASLQDLRLRYDVFYSRLTTLKDGDVFADLRDDPAFASCVAALARFVAEYLPLMDGPDAALRASLLQLSRDGLTMMAKARDVTLEGIKHFALVSDMDRLGVEHTLKVTATLTAVLIAALLMSIVFLLRLDRQALRQSRQNLQTLSRLDAIVAMAQEAIITVDDHGRIVDFNGAATQTFGHARDEVLGRDLAELMSGTDQTVFVPGKPPLFWGDSKMQIMTRHKTGRQIPVELSLSQAMSGASPVHVAFMRDLSAQLAAECALMAARDVALAEEKATSDLLVVMSHEIRTPLNGMIGTIDLLGSTDLAPLQKKYLRILAASGQLLMHHVNDVLDIARLDSGKSGYVPAPVDLQALVQDVLDNQTPAARSSGNVLQYHGPEDDRVAVVVDSALLRQVLLNLVGNAVKFTQRGTVTVRVQHLAPLGPTVISVSDTGIGIATLDLARIFDDFVTLDASYARHAAGTGLGLGIVKRIVDRLGGTLDVESQPDRGSIFRVTLPMVILDRVEPVSASPQPSQGRPMTTLVVEDNAFNQLIIADMLRLVGHDVVVASDGAEGIALATARRFDLILMDISMPRIDGLQATEAIRQPQSASCQTPIIAMTAHALPADQMRFKAAGLQTTLIKPITRKALQAVLNGAAPPVAATTLALIDVAVLRDMAGDLGADRANHLLDRFLAETGQSLADLAQRNPDPTALRDLHRLEGSAAMFGAQALRQALSQMQQVWAAGAAYDVARDLTDLQSLWQQTHQAYVEVGALPQLSSLR